MNTKNNTPENKKSLNDLKNEIIDGTQVLGGGSGSITLTPDERLEGNGSGTKNSATQTSAKHLSLDWMTADVVVEG